MIALSWHHGHFSGQFRRIYRGELGHLEARHHHAYLVLLDADVCIASVKDETCEGNRDFHQALNRLFITMSIDLVSLIQARRSALRGAQLNILRCCLPDIHFEIAHIASKSQHRQGHTWVA